jgi:hypothetical protein
MLATSDTNARGAIVGLIIVAIVAAAVWLIGRLAGRPDIGAVGAVLVAIIGALLVLLEYL